MFTEDELKVSRYSPWFEPS